MGWNKPNGKSHYVTFELHETHLSSQMRVENTCKYTFNVKQIVTPNVGYFLIAFNCFFQIQIFQKQMQQASNNTIVLSRRRV